MRKNTMGLSYAQRTREAIELVKEGCTLTAFAGGYVEVRKDGKCFRSLTFKQYQKVCDYFGHRLEMYASDAGVYASFRLAA